ncbi:MAG: hypothetical protein SPJ78_04280, partial [Corynebacterium camporealensis]|nr:hypothetical protein [Corynebacterium camporealensis]
MPTPQCFTASDFGGVVPALPLKAMVALFKPARRQSEMKFMDNTLSLLDVTKDFGGGPVLSGISMTIEPGETV